MTEQPFNPDWCVAPSGTLIDILEGRGLTAVQLAAKANTRIFVLTLAHIRDVLARNPLTPEHAKSIAAATGTSEQFWLKREADYRDGLARGLTDTTPTLEWRHNDTKHQWELTDNGYQALQQASAYAQPTPGLQLGAPIYGTADVLVIHEFTPGHWELYANGELVNSGEL